MKEAVYKLSLLRDEVQLISEDGILLTVGKLNEALQVEDETIEINDECYYKSDFDSKKWYIARKDTWSIDARRMVEREIEDSTNTETAPRWYERALDAIDGIDYSVIEKTIMEVLKKAEGVTEFYEKAERIDIEQ